MVLVISANQDHLVFSSIVPGGGRLMCGMGGGVESGMMIGASLWRRGMSRNSCPVPDSMLAMYFWNSSSFVVSSAFWAISVRRRLASVTHGCGGVTVTGKGAGVISVVPCATLVGGSVAFDTLDGCYVRIRPDPDVPRGGRKSSPADSYRLSTTERVPEENEFKSRGDKDGRSRAGGSERSEEPQIETREK